MKKWSSTWRYVPIDYGYEIGCLEDVTQIAVFRNNLEGEALRLRLNNRYGETELEITHASVWVRDRASGRSSAEYPVTLKGEGRLVLPPDSAPWSDPIPCPITCRDDIIVKMYFGQRTPVRCVCLTNAAQSWSAVQQTGDFGKTEALGFTVKAKLMPGLMDPYPNQFVVGLTDIGVETVNDPCVIGLFGDSITHMSYFSDSLIDLLYDKYPGKCAVLNGGISGNRLQKDPPVAQFMPGKGKQFGAAGKARFAADVLEGGAPDVVFVLAGVNDCSHSIVFGEPDVPTAEDIYAALAHVVAQAEEAGCAVITSTVMPFGAWGAPWRDQANGIREELNALIRERRPGGRLVDLDAVMRDPDRADVLQAGMHLGDGVHPGWLGGKKMARAVAGTLEELLSK